MTTQEQIDTFQAEHPEALIIIPAEHADAYQAGKLAVLMPPREYIEGENLVFEAIGFAKNESEALRLLRQRIVDLPAVHQREVYYYSEVIWPPVEGNGVRAADRPVSPAFRVASPRRPLNR
jgi:hypothetical protein